MPPEYVETLRSAASAREKRSSRRSAVARGSAGQALLTRFMLVNAGLAVFNLLPIPPLDGGHVADSLMPYRWRPGWERFARAAPILLLVLVALPSFGGPPILGFLIGPVRDVILTVYFQLAQAIA